MSKEAIKIEVAPGVSQLHIMNPIPLDNLKQRKGLELKGTIGLPLAHLEKITRTEVNNANYEGLRMLKPGEETGDVIETSYLEINRDFMSIVFVESAGLEYESTYTGALIFNPDFAAFGINEGVEYTPLQLAEKIKMSRSFFESRTEAMKLVSVLSEFEAKVNKEVEAKADQRANRRVLMAQTVTTNIPDGFKMVLPIFKGEKPVTFEVEIGIDPNTLGCRLISPEVNDFINDTKNEIIDAQIDAIKDLHPGLRIFEI